MNRKVIPNFQWYFILAKEEHDEVESQQLSSETDKLFPGSGPHYWRQNISIISFYLVSDFFFIILVP